MLSMIIELKITDYDMNEVALKALEQINSKKYKQELIDSKVDKIYEYAIVIGRKECSVK